MTTETKERADSGTSIGKRPTGKQVQDGASRSPKQFNFSRNWKRRIVPILEAVEVKRALTFGMTLLNRDYKDGDSPADFGRVVLEEPLPKKGNVWWYRPSGCCHYIAPFCWALGKKVYPELNWGFHSGDLHSVAVGWRTDSEQPLVVMDILLFPYMSSQQSLELAKMKNWKRYESLASYLASFSQNPEKALEFVQEILT